MNAGLAKWCVAGVIVAAAIVGCYRKVYIYEYSDGRRIESNFPIEQTPQIEIDALEPADAEAIRFTGQWRGENLDKGSDERRLQVSTNRREQRSRTTLHISPRDITGSVVGGSFEFKRDAGTLRFDRTTDDGGDVTLVMDPAFLAALIETTGKSPTAEQRITLFTSGMRLDYMQAVKETGYKPTVDELLALRGSAMTAGYMTAIRKAGYDFTPPKLLNLWRSGVTREYAVALRESGLTLTDEQLIKLSRNGIGHDYARDIKAAGYGDIDDIIELSRNGISRSFAQQMGLGGKRPAKSLIELSRNGVSPSFGESFAKLGYEFSDDDLIKLGRNGVSPTFAKSILEAGYKFSANELVELSRNGVSSDYVRKAKQAGYNLTAADLVELSRNGVSSNFLASLHDPNKPNLSVDAIVDLNRKGVDAATVKRIRGM